MVPAHAGDEVSAGQSLIARTLMGFTRVLARALTSEQIARKRGLLQSLDPRVRLIGLFLLVIAVTLSRRLDVLAALFIVALLLAVASGVSLWMLLRRVWLVVLAFTGVIALPALFLTPGMPLAASGNLAITWQGLKTALLLIARVETAVTFTTLLVLCTPWTQLLKALRTLRVPQEAILILAMTHRYIFLFVETASQMFESRTSRTVGSLPAAEQRRMTARTAGVLLSKSLTLSNEVFLAMQSRGFDGNVRLLGEFRMRGWDYLGMAIFIAAGALAVWMGR